MGTRSLKAVCTAEDSYVYWAQNVTVKKGGTYTASMYVKAVVESAAADGGCLLRIRYLDKDGEQHLLDSEILKKSTYDFVRLERSFTLPADASSNTVRIYMTVWHAKGTMYGDMAQLESGGTANRCNLIDNGDFHRGSTAGFTSSGRAEDGLTAINSSSYLPLQAAVIVTASSAIIYETPSVSAAQVVTVSKGEHLASLLFCKDADGKIWYRVRTAAAKWGYIQSEKIIPYLGGSDGVNTGATGIANTPLRAAPSSTGTPVVEYNPKGTSLAVISSVTGSDNKKWYYLGMQIDTKRYFGYMPAEAVIRLCRNRASVKMTAADNFYKNPSLSSGTSGSVAAGTTVYLRGILEKSSGEKWYVALKGKEFVFLPERNAEVVVSPVTAKLSTTKVTEKIGGLEEHIYRFSGYWATNKKLTKTLDLTGKKGDTYMVNAWGRGTSLPETDNDKERRFGVEVIFVGTDGTNDVHYTNFSPDILDWQFLSDVYVAKKDYSSIKVSYTYCHNANLAFFDGLSLFREEFGQTYTYDGENNLVSVVDAQKKASKFEYNSSNDMTGFTDPKGNKFTYVYDSKHNVTKGTSAQGVVYRLKYDTAGNVTDSGCVEPGNENAGIWVNRTMTADKNHVSTVTDARNSKVQYVWDTNKDLLTSLTDARGSKLTYGYDNAGRLTSVAQDVTQAGGKKSVKNTYTYTKDRLTAIEHNGFLYQFAYDAFGNTLKAGIAGKKVIEYAYEANNGNLTTVTYRNGDMIRYTYDSQDRMLASYYTSASGTEKKLNSYVYNRQGYLARVTNHISGKTYYLDYDFLDRLMRMRDNEGNCCEYTYDANNNMTRMYHGAGTTGITTAYAYDKDSREVTAKASNSFYRTNTYDNLGRVSKQTWSTAAPYIVSYTYPDINSTKRSGLPGSVQNGSRRLSYTYDANGNITKIVESDTSALEAGTTIITYQYDELNQLIREDNSVLNKTVTYDYDLGGNLTAVKEYAYAAGASLTGSPTKTETGTYDTSWKDKLLKWNGVSMTYDDIGNMLTKGTVKYTWTQGRKLSAVDNGKKIQYYYDHTGARVKKIVDGVTTHYRMAGDLLVSESIENSGTMWYRYDSAGNLLTINYAGKIYAYIRNIQNDIIALVDADGNEVVRYTYDSWGNLLSIAGTMKNTLGVKNPFRYRGYYYDNETGMYYLKNRYYDPEIRRFISADDLSYLTVTPMDLTNKNLYAYCDNNPDVRKDPDGKFWIDAVGALIGATVNVATTFIAAKVTGQDYGIRDAGAAALAGFVNSVGIGGKIASGLISAGYTFYTGVLNKVGGDSIGDFINGIRIIDEKDLSLLALGSTVSGVCTTLAVSNVPAFQGLNLDTKVNVAADIVFGTGYNSVAAAVSKGVNSNLSNSAKPNNTKPYIGQVIKNPARIQTYETRYTNRGWINVAF